MLPSFITEAERFASLEGNVGRKVTRHLEQLFEYGQFACIFECPDAVDIVDKGLFALRMQQCKEAQKEHAGSAFSICSQMNDLGELRVVVIPLTVPETLRAKQEQLSMFAHIMRRFVVFAVFTDRAVLDKLRHEHFQGERFTADNIQFAYLTELVEGDYTNLERTGGNVLSLASAINPVVDDRLREAFASDRIADEAIRQAA